MKKLLLLPASLKNSGIFAVLVGLAGLWMAETEGLINIYRILWPDRTLPDGSYPYPPEFWSVNSLLSYATTALIALGILLFLFTKEPDEFHYNARLEATQFAVVSGLLGAVLLLGYFVLAPGYQLINTITSILGTGVLAFGTTYVARYYYLTRRTD
jgi:hypothetical protein